MRAFIEQRTTTAAPNAAPAGHASFLAAVITLAAVLLVPTAQAKVGDVDPSYGVNGRFEPSRYGGTAVVAILNDGRVLYTVDGGYSRGDVNGMPDASFGSDGVQAWPAGYTPTTPTWASWQRTGQGKWLVPLSRQGTGGTELALLRLGEDGTPDPTFGANGVAVIDVTPDGERDPYIVVRPDGKPVLLLARHSPDDWYYYDRLNLVRLMQDGTPDGGFGTLGGVSVPTGSVEWMEGTGIRLYSNGSLVVFSNPVSCWDESGAATSCPEATDGGLYRGVADLLADGGWIAWVVVSDPGYAIAKLFADGTPDPSFQYPAPSSPDDATGAVILPGGRDPNTYPNEVFASVGANYVYAWMQHYSALRSWFTLHRFFGGGTHSGPDDGFGIDGQVEFDFSGAEGRALGLGDGSTMITTGRYAYRLLGHDAPSPGLLGVVDPPLFSSSSGAATLNVFRAAGSDDELRVRYWTAGVGELPAGEDWATPGVDFDAVSGELDWGDGDSFGRTIEIQLRNDGPATGIRQLLVRFEVLDGRTWITRDEMRVPVDYSDATPGDGSGGGGSRGGGGGAFGSGGALLALLAAAASRRRDLRRKPTAGSSA